MINKQKIDYLPQSSAEIQIVMNRIKPMANQLSVLKAHRFLMAIAFDWAVIFASIGLSLWSQSTLVYLLACVVIAARQHALMILTHEGTHFRIANRRPLNDLVSDLFAAYPVFFDTQIYRNTHFPHHQHLNSEDDPDWTRKIVQKDWQFPKSHLQLASFALTYILFRGPLEWIRAGWYFLGLNHNQLLNRAFYPRLIRKAAFWTVILATLWAFGAMNLFLSYWIVPFFAVFPSLQRLRSIAEHFGLKNEHTFNKTRDVLAHPFEAFFFGPHNVNYHLVHHMFSAVPFYNLPALHAALKEIEQFQTNAHQNSSYIWPSKNSIIADLITKGI